MDHYFFHLDTSHFTPDDKGLDLQSLDEAKRHAVRIIAEVLFRRPQTFWDADTYKVTVTDAVGLILLTVEMLAVFAPAMPVSQRN